MGLFDGKGKRPDRRWRRAALVLAQTVLALVVLELAAGMYLANRSPGWSVFRYHPVLYWELRDNLGRRNSHYFQELEGTLYTNQDGFRDCTYPPGRRPGTLRVMFMGDSCTYGYGVKGSATIEADLERLLRQERVREGAPADSVEVINAGTHGYSSYQGTWQWRLKCRKYQPDVLVLAYLYGDQLNDVCSDASRNRAPDWLKYFEAGLNRFALVKVIQRRLHGIGIANLAHHQDQPASTWVRRVSREEYRANLGYLIREMRSRGGRVVFLVLPDPGNSPGPYRQAMVNLARDNRCLLADVYSQWQPLTVAEKQARLLDGMHPNEKGCLLIAQSILQVLQSPPSFQGPPPGQPED